MNVSRLVYAGSITRREAQPPSRWRRLWRRFWRRWRRRR